MKLSLYKGDGGGGKGGEWLLVMGECRQGVLTKYLARETNSANQN